MWVFLDLFDPGFQSDAPQVYVAREACWHARTPLGYAVLRYEVAALLRDGLLRRRSWGCPPASTTCLPPGVPPLDST
jgi:hypothetical protein